MSEPLEVDATLTIPASDLVWTASRASGPGGQNVNKVASRVELRMELSTPAIVDAGVRLRLQSLARQRGWLVEGETGPWISVRSQLTRDQRQNLEDAREKLRALIAEALVPPVPRRPTRPSRASKRRRLDDKKRTGDKKAARGPVRGD